ncbi:MAG TPA: hypothetical protein VJU84_05395 [Pyrinomonadaceae bacterium]|nr:hypothetical protein [Pyrinomonadaceae bacterium]
MPLISTHSWLLSVIGPFSRLPKLVFPTSKYWTIVVGLSSILLCWCPANLMAQEDGFSDPVMSPPPALLSTQLPEPNPCKDFKNKKSFDNLILCIQHIAGLSWKGIKPTFGGVVPGSGFGGGIAYTAEHNEQGSGPVPAVWQMQFDAGARITTRKYWQIDGSLNVAKTRSDSNNRSVDLEMNFYGQVKDMPRLDFYGLGPESDQADLAKCHYRESVVGADISVPATQWMDVGAALEGIWPRLTTITDPSVRSVNQIYDDSSAPGLSADPTYLHFAGYLGLHSTGELESQRLRYDFFYHIYHDVGEKRFSFRRFDADLKHKFRLGEKSELRLRGRMSSSSTSNGQRVPFYLQETVGGSNIRGQDTLRGFDDYRFRDRHFLLLQTDFMTELRGPLKLIVFYDTGKVAPSLRRIDEGRLRHTYGAGVVIMPRGLDQVMFRFYVGLGSGEGSHLFFGPGDSILGGSNKLVR